MRVLWLPEAIDDVERLFDFLIEKDATAAERAVRTISSSAEKLQDLPQIGRPMDDDTGRRELARASMARWIDASGKASNQGLSFR